MTNTIAPEQLFNDELFLEMIQMGLINLSTLKELALQCEYAIEVGNHPLLSRDEIMEIVAPKFGMTVEIALRSVYGTKKLIMDLPKFRHNQFKFRAQLQLSKETKAKMYSLYKIAEEQHLAKSNIQRYTRKKLELLKRKKAV